MISIKEEPDMAVYPIVNEKIEELEGLIEPKEEEFEEYPSVEDDFEDFQKMIKLNTVQYDFIANLPWNENKEHLEGCNLVKGSAQRADSGGTHFHLDEKKLFMRIEESRFPIVLLHPLNTSGQVLNKLGSSNKVVWRVLCRPTPWDSRLAPAKDNQYGKDCQTLQQLSRYSSGTHTPYTLT